MSPINAVAQSGFSSADSYDAHRPSYNPAAVEFLISTLGLAGKSQAKLAEIASGTGKFTSLLSARPENFETIAVEPHGQMREVLQKKALQGVAVREGNALAVPIEDGWADSVIAAQAFHWSVRQLLEPCITHFDVSPGSPLRKPCRSSAESSDLMAL